MNKSMLLALVGIAAAGFAADGAVLFEEDFTNYGDTVPEYPAAAHFAAFESLCRPLASGSTARTSRRSSRRRRSRRA